MSKELEIKKKIDTLKKELQDVRKRARWKCQYCERTTTIGNLTLITMLFYVNPYSCTGGDYWTAGENPEYNIICPKCKIRNRILHGTYDRKYNPGGIVEKTWDMVNSHRDVFKDQKEETR